jgi:hypothetical protein
MSSFPICLPIKPHEFVFARLFAQMKALEEQSVKPDYNDQSLAIRRGRLEQVLADHGGQGAIVPVREVIMVCRNYYSQIILFRLFFYFLLSFFLMRFFADFDSISCCLLLFGQSIIMRSSSMGSWLGFKEDHEFC